MSMSKKNNLRRSGAKIMASLILLLDEMEAAKTLDQLHDLQLKYAKIGYGVPFGSPALMSPA